MPTLTCSIGGSCCRDRPCGVRMAAKSTQALWDTLQEGLYISKAGVKSDPRPRMRAGLPDPSSAERVSAGQTVSPGWVASRGFHGERGVGGSGMGAGNVKWQMRSAGYGMNGPGESQGNRDAATGKTGEESPAARGASGDVWWRATIRPGGLVDPDVAPCGYPRPTTAGSGSGRGPTSSWLSCEAPGSGPDQA